MVYWRSLTDEQLQPWGCESAGLFSSLIYEVGFGIPGWADV